MSKVLISILNWNASERTVECVESLLQDHSGQATVTIRVIDNGSSADQTRCLKEKLAGLDVDVHFNPHNTGFTGGQNANIQYALDKGFDFVWMLNNDTRVPPGTVDRLLASMQADARCGAASPVIVRMDEPGVVDFCGVTHDWAQLDTLRPHTIEDAPAFIQQHHNTLWAVGTALMLRLQAVREVGLLDDQLFAYYDDDDYGQRLQKHGWRTRIALDARVEHACFDGDMYRRPPYFFYLNTRNALLFSIKHVPPAYRRLLRLRYVDRSLAMAEKLLAQGQPAKADACLIGLADGLAGRGGAPRLNRKVPFWLRVLQPVGRAWNRG